MKPGSHVRETAAKLMSINGSVADEFCRLCADIFILCAEECDQHAKMGMEHCRECAEAAETVQRFILLLRMLNQ